MLMPDSWIRDMSLNHGLISPFEPSKIEKNKISYGLSSYGYDVRCANKFMLIDLNDINDNTKTIIDPKNFPDKFTTYIEDEFVMPGNSFVLTHTLETVHMPEDVLCICIGKSTYARCGIIVNVTPLEPGWKGQITIEISNTSNVPCKIYGNEGICQLLFYKNDKCDTPYGAIGKYMHQKNIVLPKIK